MTSRRRRIVRYIGLASMAVLLLIQIRRPARTNPPVVSEVVAPREVAEILERACYDCHSHQTRWPWYAGVAPVSWWVVGHVERGRKDLNFSDWPVLDFEELEESLGDIEEQIVKDEMPLKSYRLLHSGARLSGRDREVLLRWARSGS